MDQDKLLLYRLDRLLLGDAVKLEDEESDLSSGESVSFEPLERKRNAPRIISSSSSVMWFSEPRALWSARRTLRSSMFICTPGRRTGNCCENL